MAFGIEDAIAAGLKIADKFIPDPQAKAQFEKELRADLFSSDRAQMGVNAVEAASPSVFTSGWRPFIGWTCGAALAYQFVASPLTMWVGTSAGLPITAPPRLDGTLWELMFGMLGLGGLRTYEKLKGVTK